MLDSANAYTTEKLKCYSETYEVLSCFDGNRGGLQRFSALASPAAGRKAPLKKRALANIQNAIREYLEVAKQLAGEQNLREVEIPA